MAVLMRPIVGAPLCGEQGHDRDQDGPDGDDGDREVSGAGRAVPVGRMFSPDELYGDVYVLGYDRLFEMITSLEEQLTKLKHTLEWIDPFRGSD